MTTGREVPPAPLSRRQLARWAGRQRPVAREASSAGHRRLLAVESHKR